MKTIIKNLFKKQRPIDFCWQQYEGVVVYSALYRPMSHQRQVQLLRKHTKRSCPHLGLISRAKALPSLRIYAIPYYRRSYYLLFPNRTILMVSVSNAKQMPWFMYNKELFRMLRRRTLTRRLMIALYIKGQLRKYVWNKMNQNLSINF